MCMIVDDSMKPERTTRVMYGYKVLRRRSARAAVMASYKYKPGTNVPINKKPQVLPMYEGSMTRKVTGGVLHMYMDEPTLSSYLGFPDNFFVVVRCSFKLQDVVAWGHAQYTEDKAHVAVRALYITKKEWKRAFGKLYATS